MKNYHTHTYRCKHAVGTELDYIKAASEKGMEVLGISDHTPLPDGRWPEVRMDLSELPDHIRSIKEASAEYPDLKVLTGAECEYDRVYEGFFKDELLGRHEMDYLLFGGHYFPYRGEWIKTHTIDPWDGAVKKLGAYTDNLIDALSSGLFEFIAHPDLFAIFYHRWDPQAIACSKAIIEAALGSSTPLEINGYGYRKKKIETPSGFRIPYPIDPFWEMVAEYRAPVVFNSDAHRPEDVNHFGEAPALVEKLGLKVVDL